MGKRITFNKTGYEPFIDFIKAYAIICVLLGHTFPYLHETGYSLWYGMQVPLFLLVQCFHCFKQDKPSLSIKKVVLRVLFPFLFIQILLLVIILCKGKDQNTNVILGNFIMYGGSGPGAYYPWIYLQFAILLPIVKPWFDKSSKSQIAIVSIAVCASLEIFSAIINLPDFVYRLLAARYIFLAYFGWVWVHDGIVINRKTLFLSFLSMIAIIYFDYYYVNTEPLFYNTSWRTHRWPCYYYVAILLTYLLYLIYHTNRIRCIERATKMLARCSYEIFLIQMAVIALCPSFNFIANTPARSITKFILIWWISIVGGYFFNIIYNKFTKSIIRHRDDKV